MFTSFSKYTPIKKDESRDESRDSEEDLYVNRGKDRSRSWTVLTHVYMTCLHILLLLTAIRLVQSYQEGRKFQTRLLPSELRKLKHLVSPDYNSNLRQLLQKRSVTRRSHSSQVDSGKTHLKEHRTKGPCHQKQQQHGGN
jgi:hypothetical protein